MGGGKEGIHLEYSTVPGKTAHFPNGTVTQQKTGEKAHSEVHENTVFGVHKGAVHPSLPVKVAPPLHSIPEVARDKGQNPPEQGLLKRWAHPLYLSS